MRAPETPEAFPSPAGDRVLMVTWQTNPTLKHVAATYIALAGTRIDPKSRHRRDTDLYKKTKRFALRFDLLDVAQKTSIRVPLPKDCAVLSPDWSADGKFFAFENVTPNAVELWVGDGHTGAVLRVPDVRLNPALDTEPLFRRTRWMPDQKTLIVKLVPEGIPPPPPNPVISPSPIIQQSKGEVSLKDSYDPRDTLNNPHDEELFEYFAASQLAFVDVESLEVHCVGKVDLYEQLEVSPSGRYLWCATIGKPYSYVTTYSHFPTTITIWTIQDRSTVFAKTVSTPARLPGAKGRPPEIVRNRVSRWGYSWRANVPEMLTYTEKVGEHWELLGLEPPFEDRRQLVKSDRTIVLTYWFEKPNTALINEYDGDFRTYVVDLDQPNQAHDVIWSWAFDDKYKDPGSIVQRRLANGSLVVHQEGDTIFTEGQGNSPDGRRPFLDGLDLQTKQSRRVFRSSASCLETFLCFTSTENGVRILTTRSSADEPLNVYLLKQSGEVSASASEATLTFSREAITAYQHPAAIVRTIEKRFVNYQRKDGVKLSFTLWTPPGYQWGTRLPTIVNGYPLDHDDAESAGQFDGEDANRSSHDIHKLLPLMGYAVIRAKFPNVGRSPTKYDTLLEQIVMNARAAVKEAVRLGVADPHRIGITGFSHGGLMTALLLAHTDLFRAGVAMSGNYDKTDTAFGFNTENRTLWKAPELYRKMSPFFIADKIKTPLLLMHGASDPNPGTPPSASRKMYDAIRGNGGTTKLVMFPHEPHYYAAGESLEHCVYETLTWFDKYVRDAAPREATADESDEVSDDDDDDDE
ncbi:uncharacterized protein LTR77_000449 [Saxophila tyrrhenica]|uniref:Dipeptidyl-peptidase V n=1 Tax=Saxophila tyrrhenica TaxID=1690608 RepID=A0AAV9PNK1_9PEZI|nr:hypothetical protein LTR77_000449 [Saxophila tyrrhenica]